MGTHCDVTPLGSPARPTVTLGIRVQGVLPEEIAPLGVVLADPSGKAAVLLEAISLRWGHWDPSTGNPLSGLLWVNASEPSVSLYFSHTN